MKRLMLILIMLVVLSLNACCNRLEGDEGETTVPAEVSATGNVQEESTLDGTIETGITEIVSDPATGESSDPTETENPVKNPTTNQPTTGATEPESTETEPTETEPPASDSSSDEEWDGDDGDNNTGWN